MAFKKKFLRKSTGRVRPQTKRIVTGKFRLELGSKAVKDLWTGEGTIGLNPRTMRSRGRRNPRTMKRRR